MLRVLRTLTTQATWRSALRTASGCRGPVKPRVAPPIQQVGPGPGRAHNPRQRGSTPRPATNCSLLGSAPAETSACGGRFTLDKYRKCGVRLPHRNGPQARRRLREDTDLLSHNRMNIKDSATRLAAIRHEPTTVYRANFDALPHAPAVPGFSFYTAVQHDYPAIASILNDCFPDRAFSADSVWKSIVSPTYAFCTFVALSRSGLVVATASARRRFGMGEVAWVGCRPDHRRRGISTALVQHTCNALRQYGFNSACAVLNPPTSESLAFWGACGFYLRKEDADA